MIPKEYFTEIYNWFIKHGGLYKTLIYVLISRLYESTGKNILRPFSLFIIWFVLDIIDYGKEMKK